MSIAFTGYQLRIYRRNRGLTQKELSSVVQMSRDAIAKIEAQDRVIRDIEMLKMLQKALNIPYEVIGFIPIEHICKAGSYIKILA